jgi:hypothetical protein
MPACATQCRIASRIEADDRRAVGGKRIAGAGIVDRRPIVLRMAIVERVVDAAEQSVGPTSLSPVWLKTASRITLMPARGAATASRSPSMPPGAQVGRHEDDRVVAPGIGERERHEMPFVDGRGERL